MEATSRQSSETQPGAPLQAVPPPPREAHAETPPPKGRSRAFLILGVLAVAVTGGYFGYTYLTAGQQATDDAQIEGDVVALAPRVGGQIVKLLVVEDQHVKKGDVLIQIDDSDYAAKERQAAAELDVATAQAAAADAQFDVVKHTAKGGLFSAQAVVSGSSVGVANADAQIAVAKAGLVRAQADLRRTQQDLNRAKELRAANAVPQQQLDSAQDSYDAANAAVAQAEAQLNATAEGKKAAISRVSEARGRLDQSAPIDATIAAAKAQAELAHARVKSAEATHDLAKLQLSYTKVVAPADGVVSKLSARDGQLVQPGQPLGEVVPDATYVVANFKETQIGKMKAGDKVDVSIDTYPGQKFEGVVSSLSGGTGARFSMLPPDNASGNFVKVVQRVPVRIAWANPPGVPLRPGLSADVTIFTDK